MARLRLQTWVSRLGLVSSALVAGSSRVSTTSSGPRLLAPVAVGSYPVAMLAVAADGRLWKYCGSGLPLASVNDCPMSFEPDDLAAGVIDHRPVSS